MNVDMFMQRFDIKSNSTVVKWVEKNLIPGAYYDSEGVLYIPENALPPYTNARAIKWASIFESMLNGICQRRQILPQLYDMSNSEFSYYISELRKNDLIDIEEIEDVVYYRPTIKGESFINDRKGFKRFISTFTPIVEASTKGITAAVLEHNE